MSENFAKELRVLYVEDEFDIREEVIEFLSSRVKEIFVAKNGEEGFGLFKEKNPDMVITDIQMPIMNGLDMAAKIKTINKNMPIIVTTAFNDSDFMIKAVNIGVDGYVLKPLNIKLFLEAINKAAKSITQEKTLRKKEKFLKEYMHAIEESAIMTKTDPGGRITYANKEFCQLSGYSEEELVGKNHNIIRHGEMQASTFKNMWETIKSKKIWRGKMKNQKKDGSEFSVVSIIIPILDEDNEISEFVAIRHDITELEDYKEHLEKKIKEEVEKNREKDSNIIKTLTSFMEASPNPIAICQEKIIKYANEKFFKLISKPKEEILEKSFDMSSIFEKRDGYVSNIEELSEEKNKVSIKSQKGRRVFNLLKNRVAYFDGNSVDMYTFNDVTVNEYQKLKIYHYNARLEDYIKRHKSKRSELLVSQKQAAIEMQTPLKEQEIKEKRELNSDEKNLLRASRSGREIDSLEYAKEIDRYILDEIKDLGEIEAFIDDDVLLLKENKDVQYIYNVAQKLDKYSSVVNLLFEFEDLSYAIKSLSILLGNITQEKLDDAKIRKIGLFLSNIMMDLASWRRIVFVEQSAKDIHYMDSSLFSAILQLELAIDEKEKAVESEEDDFELF